MNVTGKSRLYLTLYYIHSLPLNLHEPSIESLIQCYKIWINWLGDNVNTLTFCGRLKLCLPIPFFDNNRFATCASFTTRIFFLFLSCCYNYWVLHSMLFPPTQITPILGSAWVNFGGELSVTVIIMGNDICDTSSNSGRGCCRFTLCLCS